MTISLVGAVIGGLLTLLSPCSVMLLPAFFSYAFADPGRLIARTGIFYLGPITTLVPLGMLAGTVGAFVGEHRLLLMRIAAAVIIALGLFMLSGLTLPVGVRARAVEGTSSLSVYALGCVYGLASTCAGPLLGAVLTVAAVSANALYGGIVLLFFAAGMTLPLLVLALVWGRLPFVRRVVRPRELRLGPWRNTVTGIIGGLLTLALGVLLLATDGTASLSGILSATDQMGIEGGVMSATAAIPDWLVIGVVALLVVAAWLIVRSSRRRGAGQAGSAGGGSAAAEKTGSAERD